MISFDFGKKIVLLHLVFYSSSVFVCQKFQPPFGIFVRTIFFVRLLNKLWKKLGIVFLLNIHKIVEISNKYIRGLLTICNKTLKASWKEDKASNPFTGFFIWPSHLSYWNITAKFFIFHQLVLRIVHHNSMHNTFQINTICKKW